MSRQTFPTAAALWLAGLTLAWGGGWPVMKYAVGELPIYTFRILTAWGGGALVLALSAARGNPIGLDRREWKPAALAALFNVTGWFYFTALGLTLMPAGRSAVLAYTMPLFAIVAARLMLREPITRQKAAGLALGGGAILLLLGEGVERLGEAPLGVLAVLGAAASWGIGTVLQKRPWQTPVLTLIGWQLLIGGIPMGVLALANDRAPFADLTIFGVLSVAYVIGVATLFGYLAWFTILDRAPAAVASIAVLPVPLVGVLSSAIFLGEAVGWRELMALLPAREWIDFSHRLIHHGRRICTARSPKCVECPAGNDHPRSQLAGRRHREIPRGAPCLPRRPARDEAGRYRSGGLRQRRARGAHPDRIGISSATARSKALPTEKADLAYRIGLSRTSGLGMRLFTQG